MKIDRNRPWLPRSTRRRRRGMTLSLELIMVLPILTFLLMAIIQFSVIMLSMQSISSAAYLGAREAATPSATYDGVADTVSDALETKVWEGLQELAIFVEGVKAEAGNGVLEGAMTGDEISVTVSVPTDQAAPDILAYIGLSTASSELTSTFVTRKE